MVGGPGSLHAPGGTVGDRYDLLDRLGTGGMGTVWRAHDRVLDRFVAVKLFDRAAAGTDPSDQSRATREAQVLAQLNHPHLVAVLDAGGESPERLDHLVMELVGGPTLRDRVRRGALSPEAVLRLGAELASALAYVHDRGVVHRDLKPATSSSPPATTPRRRRSPTSASRACWRPRRSPAPGCWSAPPRT